jgi:hypothetical protein
MNSNTNKEYSKVIVFFLVLAVCIPLTSNFFQTILAGLRYAAMDEKDASKDILVHTENDFFKFDISEYDELYIILRSILIPLYYELNDSLDIINESINDKNELEVNILNFYTLIEKWQHIIERELLNYTSQPKVLLEKLNLDCLDILNASNKVITSHADSEIKIANQQILISKIKDFYSIYINLFSVTLFGINDNLHLMGLYDHLLESFNNLENDPLIDLETPYFSLPREYAENKEKQILSHIESSNRRDTRSIMALIILYIKMKNITDAELLYSHKVAPMFLGSNKQNVDLAKTISMMLQDLRSNNPIGILDKTSISVDTNLNVNIIERYFILNPVDEKDVYVFLPYSKDDIILVSLTDRKNNDLPIKQIAPSWKNSCYLQFPCDEGLTEFSLVYHVNNFFQYSEKYGTYSYRYGGINQNNNYTCELNIPSFLKAISFLKEPLIINNDKENGTQSFMWSNPTIPFKIAVLNFSYEKNGISGEITPIDLIYNKWVALLIIFLLFIFIYFIISNFIKNELIYECCFLVISILTFFLLFWNVHFSEIVHILTKSLSLLAYRISLLILSIVLYLLFLKINYNKGNKYFKMVSSIILLSICAYGFNLLLLNSDKTNIITKISLSILGALIFFLFIEQLSKQFETSKTNIFLMVLSIIIVSFSLTLVFKQLHLSKDLLNILGLVIALIFTFIIGICFIIGSREKLRNVKNRTMLEAIFDMLNLKLYNKAIPIAHILSLSFIPILLISNYSTIILILNLIVGVFSPQIYTAIIKFIFRNPNPPKDNPSSAPDTIFKK